ncbi:MAG: cupin domain-containing protein [Betaproteobacteria bacterium]
MTHPLFLLANHAVDGAAVTLDHRDLPVQQAVSGRPRVGTAQLGALGDVTIGIWEISPSVSTDVEADEFFVVLSGAATVDFADGSPSLHLKAGSIARLAAGSATTWTVTQTLRKVYVV